MSEKARKFFVSQLQSEGEYVKYMQESQKSYQYRRTRTHADSLRENSPTQNEAGCSATRLVGFASRVAESSEEIGIAFRIPSLKKFSFATSVLNYHHNIVPLGSVWKAGEDMSEEFIDQNLKSGFKYLSREYTYPIQYNL